MAMVATAARGIALGWPDHTAERRLVHSRASAPSRPGGPSFPGGAVAGSSGRIILPRRDTVRLAEFIVASRKQIVSEWEQFARTCVSGMELEERRDHVEEMLKAIALDLDTLQTKHEQAEKSKGRDDEHVDTRSAATSHGTDRAASGYTQAKMVAEFRALRASVLRLWAEAQDEFNRENLQEVTRFNESIDQLLAESIARYAQEVERSKELFLGVLGHDLRNPLGAIMMSASLMISREGPDWLHLKTASRMLSSGTRMLAMIDDLLDFTRSRLGTGIPVVRADMDMETTCRQTVDEIIAFHPRCIVHFEASGELRGQWDSGRIGQALSNVVGNAFQHGSADVPVEVSVRGEAASVVLTVHNKGPAIAKNELLDIFNPFRQLETAGTKKRNLRSAGLGLYIAQAIVTAHQGTIDVESSENGTTFTVRLPRSHQTA
ncbi:MAG TPA: HAMP domain-containing sensor histidine kinase [Polyangiaceae bacterium]